MEGKKLKEINLFYFFLIQNILWQKNEVLIEYVYIEIYLGQVSHFVF